MKDNCQLLVNVGVLSNGWPLGRPGPAGEEGGGAL